MVGLSHWGEYEDPLPPFPGHLVYILCFPGEVSLQIRQKKIKIKNKKCKKTDLLLTGRLAFET